MEHPPAPCGIVTDIQELLRTGQRFPTVYADPPWEHENTASRTAARKHYRTLPLVALCSLPVADWVTSDAHLHLSATSPLLPQEFEVIDAWGFRYASCFVWTKPKLGMGNYWRVSHEFLLLGVRGSSRFSKRDQRSWQTWARTRHSRKPLMIRMLIEQVSSGPYLEPKRLENPASDNGSKRLVQ